jgi:hypothetical protein
MKDYSKITNLAPVPLDSLFHLLSLLWMDGTDKTKFRSAGIHRMNLFAF